MVLASRACVIRRPGCLRTNCIDAVAVTAGPGLAGALMVGVAAAKAYAYALGKPLYGVNHLAAHVAVDQLEHGPLPSPCLALLVSARGGEDPPLLLVTRHAPARVRSASATTIDDIRGREPYDQGRPGARHAPIPAVPRSTAPPPPGTRPRSEFPRAKATTAATTPRSLA